MDRNYDAPETRFALELLRRHPQISYEHAVSAAQYSGVSSLPRGAFLAAADRLGIRRERVEPSALPAPDVPTPDAGSNLLAQLDRFRDGIGENAKIREALLRMQKVVRAALASS